MRGIKTNSLYQRTLSITAPVTIAVFVLLSSSHILAQDAVKKESTRNIETLNEKLQILNYSQIFKINKFLQKNPRHPRRSDLIFQKSELLFEQSRYKHFVKRQQWLDCLEHQQNLNELSKCDKPTPDHTIALKGYQELLEQRPSSHTAMALYRVADILTESNEPSQAMPILIRLFQEYPQFERRTDAYSIFDTIITTDWARVQMVVPNSWLGVRLESTQLNFVVVKVVENSSTHKHGLKSGDRITHINNIPIKTKDHAKLLVSIKPPETLIKLTLTRGSKVVTVNTQTIPIPPKSTLDTDVHSPAR